MINIDFGLTPCCILQHDLFFWSSIFFEDLLPYKMSGFHSSIVASITETSEVHTAAMLILLTVGNWKVEYCLVRGPFEMFVDSPCGSAVTVSFSKYLPWQAMHFLQRSTRFSKTWCRPFAASFRRIVEQAVMTFHIRFSVSKAFPPL
jgi:hypothetical protein